MEEDKLQGVNCQHHKWKEIAVAIWEDHFLRPIWEGKCM